MLRQQLITIHVQREIEREREKRARYIVVVVDLILTDQPTGMEWKKVCKTSKWGVVCWDIT